MIDKNFRALSFYATDPEHVSDLIRYGFRRALLPSPPNMERLKVLDPCAGGFSSLFGMPYADELRKHGAQVDTMDIRHDSLAAKKADFLRDDVRAVFGKPMEYKWDLIISNPPFPLYREFVERSYDLATCVIFLLPLNVTEPRKRSFDADLRWWRKYRPHICFEHCRMKFGGERSSAFQQYGHFVWYPDTGDGRYRPVEHYPVYDWSQRG